MTPLIKARLDAAAKRWEREDRERGYTVYRQTKPVYQVTPKQATRAMQAAIAVGLATVGYMILVLLFSL